MINVDILDNVKCYYCEDILTEENYNGWFDIVLSSLGFEIKVPVCNICIESNI